MTCGFNLACHMHELIAPFWFWLFWGFWAVVAALGLWALSKVKAIAGWPGVAAVAGAVVYALGYFRGRSGGSLNPLEQVDEDSADARPSPPEPKRSTVRRPSGKRVYNPDTNSWN